MKRSQLPRSTPLRPRSRKQQKLYRDERVPLVIELLSENPLCERCHSRAAVDVHEIKTRARGGSILDRDNLAVLCRPCHSWVTDNPAEAHEEGWLKHSWDL